MAQKPHNSQENFAVYQYIQYSKLTGRMAKPDKEKFWIVFLFKLISLPLLETSQVFGLLILVYVMLLKIPPLLLCWGSFLYIYKKFQRTAIYSFFLTMMSIFKACLTSEVSWFCSPCRESIDVGKKRKKKQQPITAFSMRWLASENSRKPKNWYHPKANKLNEGKSLARGKNGHED